MTEKHEQDLDRQARVLLPDLITALRSAEDFIADELQVREISMYRTYIRPAKATLKTVRAAIDKAGKIK